jgi:hypothetical protein
MPSLRPRSYEFAEIHILLIMAEQTENPMPAADPVFNAQSREHLFIRELKEVPGPVRKVLEEYSGIDPDRVLPHIVEIVRLP